MKVIAHLDPRVLEQELLRLVDEAHPRDRPAPTLVLVPATRLAAHVRLRLAQRRQAWLGLEVLHFRQLAFEILRRRGSPSPTVASAVLLDALLERVLRERPSNLWSRWIRRRPGALRRLRETLVDLREAGLEPSAVDAMLQANDGERDLAALFGAYHLALEGWSRAGWTDDAGLLRAALPFAADHVRASTAAFVHGAYELIGVNLDLVRELDRGTELTLLLPGGPAGPAGAHAADFARRFLLEGDAPFEAPAALAAQVWRPSAFVQGSFDFGPEARRDATLASLYDEDSRPAPAAGEFLFRHTQGAAAEVKVAVREALLAVAGGCSPSEIVITARSLAPYAAAIEEVFAEERLPWTTSLVGPLRRQPVVRDFLLLLEVVAGGFPRRATVELLRSPRVRWPALVDVFVDGDRADVWSREAKVIGGLEEWSTLPAWAAAAAVRSHNEDAAQRWREGAERVVLVLHRLGERVRLDDRRFGEHAAGLRELLDELFASDEQEDPALPAIEMLRGLLDDMTRLESLLGETRPVPFETARHWLAEAVDRSELASSAAAGGFRVLDAMQMRGMTCRHLHVLGMNAALFPRPPREDCFLADARRSILAERTGRPVPVKARAASEERLILALLLGAASERTVISWQRADESGRAKTPSLALREVARIALGKPSLEALRSGEDPHVPSHPTHALEWLVRRTGLLSHADGRLLAALYGQEARLAAELAERYPELTPGLDLLRATQAFGTVDPAYDACIGPGAAGLEISVTSCADLGHCPLKFFFSRVLRVRELEEPASAFELKSRELGSAIHRLLQSIYGTLEEEGAFAGSADRLVARGLGLLRRDEGLILGEAAERLSRRLPLLWGEVVRAWARTLQKFLENDLARLHAAGLRPVALERLRRQELDFGLGVRQTFSAKFDRELEGPNGLVVGDYKVSRNLADRVKGVEMLRGQQLQVPLYRMLAGGQAEVELLGIHPALEIESGEHRVRFGGLDHADESSFADTMRSLLAFKTEGQFPFQKGHLCNWCVYTMACRRLHPPSQDRQAASAAGATLARLRAKKAGVDAG